MSRVGDPRVRDAVEETRQALSDLIDPQVRGFLGDDLRVTQRTAPSLLAQLRDAIANSKGAGGVRAKSRPIPIAADAVDLLGVIARGTEGLIVQMSARPSSYRLEDRLRAVVDAAALWDDPEVIHVVRGALSSWANKIRTLLDPPRRMHLAAPCPECGVSMVLRRDESVGEDVRSPALQVDGRSGCDCLACGRHWAPEQFEFLARVLGCPPPGVPAA